MKNKVFIPAFLIATLAVVQGCAKQGNTNRSKAAAAVAPAGVKGTPNSGGTSLTAINVAATAYYYGFEASRNSSNFSDMLSADGGCQMAQDFSDAIAGNDLIASVTIYCAQQSVSPAGCAQAKVDAQKLISDINTLSADCGGTDGTFDSSSFGDQSVATDLETVAQNYRADLGLPAAK
jgi:hypothetical protein